MQRLALLSGTTVWGGPVDAALLYVVRLNGGAGAIDGLHGEVRRARAVGGVVVGELSDDGESGCGKGHGEAGVVVQHQKSRITQGRAAGQAAIAGVGRSEEPLTREPGIASSNSCSTTSTVTGMRRRTIAAREGREHWIDQCMWTQGRRWWLYSLSTVSYDADGDHGCTPVTRRVGQAGSIRGVRRGQQLQTAVTAGGPRACVEGTGEWGVAVHSSVFRCSDLSVHRSAPGPGSTTPRRPRLPIL